LYPLGIGQPLKNCKNEDPEDIEEKYVEAPAIGKEVGKGVLQDLAVIYLSSVE
jgi:hypothetical protein